VNAYTLRDAARICGVSRRRLRYWERTALVRPSAARGRQTAFVFRDLVGVRSIARLLARGVPLRRIRRHVEAVRARLPGLEPLSALAVWEGSERVVVRHQGVWMEPDGQLVLDLGGPGGAGVAPFAPRREAEPGESAEVWFERGCELDADPETYEEAIAAYRRALELEPDFADAHCNLGSVFFNQSRRADARDCYQRALELEPAHLEANLNLGALFEEAGRDERALRHYRTALESDPLSTDAHVSLALVYEKLGLARKAGDHWRRYLQIDPRGPWADVARRHLAAH
jgi:tetratricopeptide (TPR) repeat protein